MVPLAIAAIGAGAQSAIGLAQLGQSIAQNAQAKKLSRKLIRPDYEIPQEYRDNLSLAESFAGQGMSDAAMEVYKTNANNTLTSSIDAILRGGGSVNNVADLYDTSEDNFASLAAIEDELRLKRQQIYMDANENVGNQEVTRFQVNEYAPYQDQKQLIAQLRGQANDNKWKGLNTVGQAVGNFAMSSAMPGGGTSTPGMGVSNPMGYVSTAGIAPSAGPNAASIIPQASPYAQNIQDNLYLQSILQRAGRNISIQ